MNIRDFVDAHGEHIRMYKVYDNGNLMVKFDNPDKIMFLKRVLFEDVGFEEVTANVGRTYWFAPASHTCVKCGASVDGAANELPPGECAAGSACDPEHVWV